MIMVELTRDMRPKRAGDDWLLPDETALSLLASGQAKNPRDRFGAPLPSPGADARGRGESRRYRTK